MTTDVRPLDPADLLPAWTLLEQAFGHTPHPADTDIELALVDPSRFYAVHDDGGPVATAGSFDLTMAVPGRVTRVAGVSWVAVSPTARRRGLLTAMMQRQLGDLHESGTALAALWASEGAIYGRYGYGPASWMLSVTLGHGAALRTPVDPGGLRLVPPDRAALAPVYDVVAARQPGFPARDDAWWAYRLHDPEHRRGGSSPLQCVVTDGGYALYAVAPAWTDGRPAGAVEVREIVATDEGARTRLWRYLLDLDLSTEVRAWSLAPDDPLLLTHLADPRAARSLLRDGLWVRVLDVPTALAARRYACDVDVVLEVEDRRCPWNTGRWRLSGGRDDAACERTSVAADLVVGPEDLGAAFLGGTPLRSRPVQELTPGALDRASAAFGPVGAGPWCPLVF